jgi:hypothetical protein
VLKFNFLNFRHPHRKNHFATLPVRYMKETPGLILGQKIVNLFVILLNSLTWTDKPKHRATVSLKKKTVRKSAVTIIFSHYFFPMASHFLRVLLSNHCGQKEGSPLRYIKK